MLPVLALGTVALHLLFAGRYGYFRDELYFLVCGQRLDWGYVDQPPLIAVAARLAASLFGESLVGIRTLPALAAGGLVALTGWLTRRLGGGTFAMALAGVAVALAPFNLFAGHTLTMNAFEPLFWMGCAALLVEMIRTDARRPWLAMGALIGVGVLNKHSMGFFAVSLALGLLLTPERRLMRSRWLAFGAVLATVHVLPHVLWQWRHGLPMLELLRNGQLYKNAPFALGEFLSGQVLLLHPLFFALSLVGLLALVFSRALRPYRALGLGFLVLLGLYILMKAKAYYMAPAYPMLVAAGAGVLERAVRRPLPRAAVLTGALAGGALLLPLTLPVLPVERFIAYQRALGLEPPRTERHRMGVLPQHYADQHGWRELVAAVAEVYHRLSPEEQARTMIFAQNYGEAGAVDWLGRAHGLPPARSGHNHYFLWGPGDTEPEVLIIIGGDAEDHAQACSQLEVASRLAPNPYVMPYEDQLPLYLCRGLKAPMATLWPKVKHYQ
ncbi:ArnT family glycosyltransferase [Hyalangium rubrum]|uniref:Glycosyltransferase family 39 protein n=1 Tax=Hyalangium rubrum TaxID=3103134 RepID=A0ABU5GZ88_9BACT|nr:glycosyltransferase family 39 protein [Hyalangium sp. s54d21]MDY7226488.1 glycosyltransferase family 39 protein [Hyalangium sp. s54d21]